MSDRLPSDETVDHLAPDSSVLQSQAANLPEVPGVHLREPLADCVTPVKLPASPEKKQIIGSSPRLLLIGEIARGGMGIILKGHDIDLGRALAVKVLLEEHRDKPELVQ